jgi:hypothetical protein
MHIYYVFSTNKDLYSAISFQNLNRIVWVLPVGVVNGQSPNKPSLSGYKFTWGRRSGIGLSGMYSWMGEYCLAVLRLRCMAHTVMQAEYFHEPGTRWLHCLSQSVFIWVMRSSIYRASPSVVGRDNYRKYLSEHENNFYCNFSIGSIKFQTKYGLKTRCF